MRSNSTSSRLQVGAPDTETPSASRRRLGGISFLHRFDSPLNHHVHFHVCVTDGVFVPAADDSGCHAPPTFLPARPIPAYDLAALTERGRRLVIRWFRLARLLDAAAAADMLARENSGFSVDASVRITRKAILAKLGKLLGAVLLVSFIARSATAADIYVLSGTTLTSSSPAVPTDFGVIDSATGVYTSIQTDINSGNTLWGLTYNPVISRFYAISNEGGFTGGGLRLLNTAGVFSAPVGSGFSNYSMAYNPAEDAIYGYNYNTDEWYTMDPSTGARTARGTGPGVADEPTGGRGLFTEFRGTAASWRGTLVG